MFGSYGSTRIEESRRWTVGFMLLAAMATLSGCIYDAPLTANGTRRVDARLVGDWTSDDGKENLKTAYAVSSEIIPSTLKSSSEARRRVRASLEDPKLFVDEPLELSRRK